MALQGQPPSTEDNAVDLHRQFQSRFFGEKGSKQRLPNQSVFRFTNAVLKGYAKSMNTFERWMSLAVATAFCGFALWLQPTSMMLVAIGYMILPLVAIWYGDDLGGFASGWRLNQPTPGIMVRVAGWILLLITPLAVYAFKLRIELGI